VLGHLGCHMRYFLAVYDTYADGLGKKNLSHMIRLPSFGEEPWRRKTLGQ
jgi:hypothetical protein